MATPARWRVEFRHASDPAGVELFDGMATNTYTLPAALRMLMRWSPNVRTNVRLVRA